MDSGYEASLFSNYHQILNWQYFINACSIVQYNLCIYLMWIMRKGCHLRLNVNNISIMSFDLLFFPNLTLALWILVKHKLICIEMACCLIASEGEGLCRNFAVQVSLVLFFWFLQNFGMSLVNAHKYGFLSFYSY